MPDEGRVAALKEILEANPDDAFARYALGLEYSGAGETRSEEHTSKLRLVLAPRSQVRLGTMPTGT